MKQLVKHLFFIFALLLFTLFFIQATRAVPTDSRDKKMDRSLLSSEWDKFSGGLGARVVYADPPHMIILDLKSGTRKNIPGIVTEGGAGRWRRGKTPRPSWSPDGEFFSYRHSGALYIADETGIRKQIRNGRMDTSKETRWSVVELNGKYHVFGPSKKGKGIAVNIENNTEIIEVFPHPVIDLHCELTADGKYIVYNSGRDIYVAEISGGDRGVRISKKQNCRPCASPVSYAAWLPAPHFKYNLHNIRNGRFIGELKAPEKEEIYRLNWSNREEYAVHMFGSRGNTRMHIRKISTGEYLYIGDGWDPDLWVGGTQ